jgi:hypothetical protein
MKYGHSTQFAYPIQVVNGGAIGNQRGGVKGSQSVRKLGSWEPDR